MEREEERTFNGCGRSGSPRPSLGKVLPAVVVLGAGVVLALSPTPALTLHLLLLGGLG